MFMMSRRVSTARLVVGFALVAGLAACGGTATNSAETVPASPNLTVLGLDIKFDAREYSVKAGTVSLAYLSKGQQSHNLIIEDGAGNKIGKKLLVGPGGQTGQVIAMTAGTYKMYCDVPGHRQSMNAVLTVT